MNFPLTPFQAQMLPVIRGLVADKPWLPASYVMAHVRIESGWNPTIVAPDGSGSVGLMQVLPSTVEDMIRIQMIEASQADQSVAENSLATGVAYIRWIRNFLMNEWHFVKTISYHPVCESYNQGIGNTIKGILDQRYFLKWAAAQQGYAFVDMEQKC